jgi:hypothetical protein
MDFLRGMDKIGEEKPVKRDRAWAMKKLREMKVREVAVNYSGGNDSGGVEDILVVYEDDTRPEETWEEPNIASRYNPETHKYEKEREMTEDEWLREVLCQEVYNIYGGFAGECSVDGKIIWDVRENKIENSGEEEVYSVNSYENTLYNGNEDETEDNEDEDE